MTTRKHIKYFLLILSFLLTIDLIDSLYLRTKRTEKELPREKAQNVAAEDDVDLETYLEDYYDDLWRYLDKLGKAAEKMKQKKKPEIEKTKSNSMDYEYMSDMPAGGTEVEEKKFKSLDKDITETGMENFTWSSANEPDFNDGFGNDSNGMLDIIRANRESNSQEEYPPRSKQMRLQSIIEQVLSFRGGPKVNDSSPDVRQYNGLSGMYEKSVRRFPSEEWSSSYTEKLQSFYPSCDLPRNTDEDVWDDPYSMNLMFDLTYPMPQEDSVIMIVTAKLRLFKIPHENYTNSNTDSKTRLDKNQDTYAGLPYDEDRQIRVSVYWYTRSLRRHRVKKRLLDSQMLSLHEAKWTEFNIRPAVRTWKESGKNYGLVVNVEDEDGTLLPAEQYIQTMNCSKWTATIRPIPSIIIDRMNQYFVDTPSDNRNETFEDANGDENKHKIYSYQPFLFPTIDLRTREVPSSDVDNIELVNSAKKSLETKFLNIQRKGFGVTDDSIGNFLKKNNLNIGDIIKLSRVDKSVPRKSETRNGEPRVSYFQNVPLGSPSRGIPEKSDLKEEKENEQEEKVMPRIRHNRKQWDMYQKTNTNSHSRNDFNATDHD